MPVEGHAATRPRPWLAGRPDGKALHIRPLIRKPLQAALLLVVLSFAAAPAPARFVPCDRDCIQRVKERAFAERYGGCQSRACVRRVRYKREARMKPRAIGRRMAYQHGEPWRCVDQLIHRESGWRVTVANAGSGAYGLPQALPGHKMASAGPNWRTSARTQMRWFFRYVRDRYRGACAALAHSHAHGWY